MQSITVFLNITVVDFQWKNAVSAELMIYIFFESSLGKV